MTDPKYQGRYREYDKIYSRKQYYEQRRYKELLFKNKRLILKDEPKTGVCQMCKKKVGDQFIAWRGKIKTIKFTHIHHTKYNNDDPLKDTMELCPSCHCKITMGYWKNKKL